MKKDLAERLFRFAVNILRFLGALPNTVECNIIKYQLGKAATASGANYEESQAGASRADFNNKVDIALKEMRESNYWLRILEAMNLGEEKTRKELVQESSELKKILGSIAAKTSS